MGTQRSSEGPGSGVPLVPSWVQPVSPLPDNPSPGDGQAETLPNESQPSEVAAPVEVPQIVPRLAQRGRFKGARTSLGSFAASGSKSDLQTGLGHYVRSGYSGASQLAQRMSRTAKAAGLFYGGLEAFRSGENKPVEFGLDRDSLRGRPAREVGDKIIEAICPIDGSQDAEASRDSLTRSISDLLEQNPDLDLTALSPEQIDFLVEGFVANDLAHRIELDVGKTIFEKAPDTATAVHRMQEMRDYVREKVSASFRARNSQGQKFTRASAANLTASVLKDTLAVFEEYIR
jgi:hypothetical protein